jgi:predicted dehydrogenase
MSGRDPDPTPLRYALIGAGSVARTHLREIGGVPGLCLVGVADPAPPNRWRISVDDARVPRFDDASILLRETAPDLVSICTPPSSHHGLTLLALSSGAHVVCEKPMATTLADAEEMEKARAAAGRIGAINFGYRNLPAFRFARDLIARGEIGRVVRVDAAYLQSFMAAPTTPWSWRNDAAVAGFGALGDLGVHVIDAVRFVTGLEFVRVVGSIRTFIPEKRDGSGHLHRVTTDTHASWLADLGDHAMASFETTHAAPGYGDLLRIEVSGESGTLRADSETPDRIRLSAPARAASNAIWRTNLSARAVPPDFEGPADGRSPRAIVAAIRGSRLPFPTFADGVAAQRVLDGLVRSVRARAWVDVA